MDSSSISPEAPVPAVRRRGAVAVIVREQRLLVIRRSQSVLAPGAFCFPGGGIEDGETEEDALAREMREELAVAVLPRRRIWSSITAWGYWLAWWLAELQTLQSIHPNPDEVESTHWMTVDEMAAHPELLDSNREFLAAWRRAEFEIDGLEGERSSSPCESR